MFKWKSGLNDWYPHAFYTFEYNSFGTETKQYIDYWDSNANSWSRDTKIETAFYPDGAKRSFYRYHWNSEQSDWTKRNDDWMEFDSLGRLTKQMETNIGSSALTEYVYDSAGNFIIYYSASPPWIGDFNPRTKFIITINENQERKIVEEYRLISESWIPTVRTENRYSPLGIKFQTNCYSWADALSKWNLGERSHYYYKSSSTEVISEVIGTHSIFPNPTSGILNIDGFTGPVSVKVYSLQGHLLISLEQVENTIDISDLPTGVYIINLIGGSNPAVRKMVAKQ